MLFIKLLSPWTATSSSSRKDKAQSLFSRSKGRDPLKKQNKTKPWPQIPLQLIMVKLFEKAVYSWSQLWSSGSFLLLLSSCSTIPTCLCNSCIHSCNQFLTLNPPHPCFKDLRWFFVFLSLAPGWYVSEHFSNIKLHLLVMLFKYYISFPNFVCLFVCLIYQLLELKSFLFCIGRLVTFSL